jgi:ketosteroid isomerase-like protein
MRNWWILMLGAAACSTSKAGESETPLAMADSARAYDKRMSDAMQNGDSAAYMAGISESIVMAGEGVIFKDRNAYAGHIGRMMKAEKVTDAGTSDAEIRVVGPRAVAVTRNHHFTKADSSGKPVKVTGVSSGVLGVENGRTVILQVHMSEAPSAP